MAIALQPNGFHDGIISRICQFGMRRELCSPLHGARLHFRETHNILLFFITGMFRSGPVRVRVLFFPDLGSPFRSGF